MPDARSRELDDGAKTEARAEDGRGRRADQPQQIPKRGWRDIALRVWNELSKDNIGLLAAGVAFYSFTALFPGLVALISIYGLVADPVTVQEQVASGGGLLPPETRAIIEEQLTRIAEQPSGSLGFGALFGLAIALWSASRAVAALMTAFNVAYEEEEKRGFIRLNLTALALTLGGVLLLGFAMIAVVVVPVVLAFVGLGEGFEWLIRLGRWPLLAAVVMVALAVLYRIGPSREQAAWRWVSPGALVATLLWLAGSILFSWYVANFGSYNETYGSVGAVIILLLWMNLSAYVVILGAEINAETEHQTAEDTTTGPDRPIGERGATMADRVGPVP